MNPAAHILIVDDEPAARHGMRRALEGGNYTLSEAVNGHDAFGEINRRKCDVVLCDVHMPEMDGLQLLRRIQSLDVQKRPLVIVITAYGSEKVAVEAMKAGAYDYLAKPYDIDELRLIVRNAVEKIRLQQENLKLRRQLAHLAPPAIIGESSAIKKVINLIEKVGPTDVTVLLSGESGTGKELVARNIHLASSRAGGPFITMNCAAIPRDLVESELFGHEKGAFTGASTRRAGKFELGNGGTLLLDEIADMNLETQAKILRVLEDKSFIRLGGKQVIHADVRLISATNKDLHSEIQRGRFREDLYFRLKVVEIPLPSLSQRREDVPLLVNHFVRTFAEKHGKAIPSLDPEVMRRLVDFNWPGNIRQLMHVIEQSVVLAEGDRLEAIHLPEELCTPPYSGGESFSDLKRESVRRLERDIIEKALRAADGNISEAARRLNMKRQFLQSKIRSLGINAGNFRV